MTRTLVKEPKEVIFRQGKPVSVIMDIKTYKELLERLEDIEDLKTLKEMRKNPLHFRKLEDFLKEYQDV